MKILAVDTATEACSAALLIDGNTLERYQLAPREHTKLILPMIDSLLAEAEITPQNLDMLAFGRGPGSFTGVRIATGIIQGMAFAANLPVTPISTLAAIAQDCIENTAHNVILTAVDARMNEIYWAVYHRNPDDFVELVGRESVIPIHTIEYSGAKGFGIGSAWKIYETEMKNQLSNNFVDYDSNYLPRAAIIAKLGARNFNLGKTIPVEQAMPVYLRNKVAEKESERKK